MHRTLPLQRKWVSGQRRILKRARHLEPLEYMKKAVETGIWRERGAKAETWGNRKPRHLSRPSPGPNGEPNDYPWEYDILSRNQPLPEPMRVPVKLRRERERFTREHGTMPTDRLVKSYLRRYEKRMAAAHPLTDDQKEEANYARTLGLGESESHTAMGRKAAVLDHAYRFAIRQYEVLRMHDDEGMTEGQSVKVVEKLLADEAREERIRSRKRAEAAEKWREARERLAAGKKKAAGAAAAASGETEEGKEEDDAPMASSSATTPEESYDDEEPAPPVSTVPSVLAGNPRAIRAMTMWARRLAAVPYHRWTVGAASALDHWIAVDVLGLSEAAWKNALRGDPGEDEEIMTGRLVDTVEEDEHGREMRHPEAVSGGTGAVAADIVAVRGSLFPETLTSAMGDEEEEEAAAEAEANELDATQRSIDELLASLGGFDEAEETKEKEEDHDEDAKMEELTDELQEWRAKNAEKPFDEWKSDDKEAFNTWLSRYIEAVTTDTDGPVDLVATREALLSEPPTTRDQNDAFWSSIKDETSAEILLQALAAKGAQEGPAEGELEVDRDAREKLSVFLSLPYERQLRSLMDLGTLRPVFDEYTPESERLAFLKRHGDALLEGSEMEHLVVDPAGPIRAEDVGREHVSEDDIKKGLRYRIEMMKYGSDEYGKPEAQRARALFRAWNEHKSGRAMYEEHMFKLGKLSLEDKGKESWVALRKKKRGDQE
uniref:Uncharacterized protein n=1 Tax=Trieres chinensis TaxID=1514140 RepID=A0A7S1ZIB8_TRICV|mmetsp:Transcript_25970/g.53123  ORF Transcript_25970/g.53123 Transcript_25970/m.53123 type:complete len:717 (+) Transcript_25970:106-2256(+)|eukprot:CAMPEP_0183308650 /NCGR_PEP_ID=MMETSP0160_2-20130417/22377_1 /TAXON_ID=2839 ORGANISM="Odontella Sinensis, Strain Grunow 1884" /NCGR_SAMPLE_ID=MMETSP0160_2 /ASSEMBLY_ACC=CAM_ASM_000250 /LENGTH=716 /DNA_ID=CAMNT_0025472519 /DNA_START=20 /DNA_END=2170 /DNA_ORIENTATION=-